MELNKKPLADRIRPKTIDDVCGQKHILGENKVLRKIVESNNIPNLIFYGPSGVGKTTVANIIAKQCGKRLFYLNATIAGSADIKKVVSDIDSSECGIILYLDEIQYFNKKQQQILLSYIENGDITLIASTTENPFFYVYNAILSRSTVFEFKPLSNDDIVQMLKRAIKELEIENSRVVKCDDTVVEIDRKFDIKSNDDVINKIARSAAGDARRALNTLELCFNQAKPGDAYDKVITDEIVEQLLSTNSIRYDREGDEHYDVISAYQKSMRGSDANAALHYLARLLLAGDLQSACRRLLVCASEDVGLAYPQIIPIVKAAVDTALQVGMPEARIPLADAVILVCNSPKSNSGETAIDAAISDVQRGLGRTIPRHLQNKHCDGVGNEEQGQNYKYPHSYPNHWVEQQYLPDDLKNRQYYKPGDNLSEQKFAEGINKMNKRKKSTKGDNIC